MKVNISSIDARWYRDNLEDLSIEDSLKWKVHSRFKHAINLLNETGELMTVLVKGAPNAPSTLLVDLPHFEDCNPALDVGEDVVFNAGRFCAGENEFRLTTETEHWHQVFTKGSFSLSERSSALGIVFSLLQRKTVISQDPVMDYIHNQLQRLHREIQEAIEGRDSAQLMRATKAVMGLGLGLTPSGDDLLVGLLLILYCQERDYQREIGLISSVISESREQTHDISWWMLHHASLGFFNEWLLDYAGSLRGDYLYENENSRKSAQHQALLKILSIGSLSGSDMLRGIALGLSLEKSIAP